MSRRFAYFTSASASRWYTDNYFLIIKGRFPLSDIFCAKRHLTFAPIVPMCLLRKQNVASREKCRREQVEFNPTFSRRKKGANQSKQSNVKM